MADRVVSLAAVRDKKETEGPKEEESASDLEKVMERNKANAERVAKERLNANRSVLRSYRIKH